MKHLIFNNKRIQNYSFVMLCICIMLIFNGAIPFLSMPNFQQAVWAQGFAKSFSNQSILSIYANNFGFPALNPISFGLVAMLPSSILTNLGFGAAESYSFIFLIYLVIGFIGTYKWSRIYLNEILSSMASLIWTIQPIVLLHNQDYSMLGLGIVMLPTYCYVIYKFYITNFKNKKNFFYWSLAIFCTALLSVFLDGYTYVMFCLFSIISWFFLSMIEADKSNNKKLIYRSFFKLSIVITSIAISYLSYSSYFNGSDDWISPIDFYRGWGVDLSFIVIPTFGRNFIGDLLSFSLERSSALYFGDSSVWKSTYCLPILFFYILSILNKKNKNSLFYLMIIVSFISIYLAMGPSLKVFSVKPDPNLGVLMSSEFAVTSLGPESIWTNVPGLKAMRATYRWMALFIFSAWIIMVKFISEINFSKNKNFYSFLLLALVFIFSIPNINSFFPKYVNNREMMNEIEHSLSQEISNYIDRDEIALFLPMNNDFLANSLSSYGEFKTYNIGGDKNVAYAKNYLPKEILDFNNLFIQGKNSNFKDFDYSLMQNLVKKKNVIIIPYFSLLFPNPTEWQEYNYCFKSIFENEMYNNCLLNNPEKIKYEPLINNIKSNESFTIIENDMYIVIKNS